MVRQTPHTPQLQVPLVACPRNHLYRHEEVASFWRPLSLLGDGQHSGQIALQFNPGVRPFFPESRTIASTSPRSIFTRFYAGVWMLQRLRKSFDFL